MKVEYFVYTIPPLLLGYIGERYKDMSTIKYSIIIFLTLTAINFALYLGYGDNFIPDRFTLYYFVFGGGLIISLFHLQKVARRKKKLKATTKN